VENAQADPYVQRLLSASREQIIPSHRIDVYLMRFKVDSARGQYREAIRYNQQYKALTDAVFNEKKSEQISRLSIQYDTGKKEQALRLREKDVALLTARSKTQQAQRNALVGGTALLLALLGVTYNRYRLKGRSNRLLRAQREALQSQQEELQAHQEEMRAQHEELQTQQEIHEKNAHLSKLLGEKESLLRQQHALLGEKDLLLAEKERLLKEIHHRVKNNLQIVMSLLNSQAASLEDKVALSAIQESQHRVQAMALIHQKLYQSEQVARVDMAAYLRDLVVYLRDSYQPPGPGGRVHLELDMPPLNLDVTLAVPLGLIANEAVTNALKYAFPSKGRGTVRLSLHRLVAETAYELVVGDNGPGLPPGYDPPRSRSLGMTLMHGLGEQLGGELRITGSPGVTLRLTFPGEQPGQPVMQVGNGSVIES
jgi:two-component sensor histidine kinase